MRMVMIGTVIAAAAMAGAPAATQPKVPETIRYETGPCFGACPVYTVQVSSDGQGIFAGTRFTAVTGERRFSVSPAQFAEFRRRLHTVRPHGEVVMTGPPLCTRMATDLPSADIRWSGPHAPAHLVFSFGCDMDKHRDLAGAIRRAPDALPIADLIGQARRRGKG